MVARVDYRIVFKKAKMPRSKESVHTLFAPTKDHAIRAAKAIKEASFGSEDAIITDIAVLAEHTAVVVYEYPAGCSGKLLWTDWGANL